MLLTSNISTGVKNDVQDRINLPPGRPCRVSACNVTTSGVTAPQGGGAFKNGHVYDIESDGSPASAMDIHTASSTRPGTDGGTGGGTGGGPDPVATFTMTGSDGSRTSTTHYSDGSTSGESHAATAGTQGAGSGSGQREVIGGMASNNPDGTRMVENHYSDGTYSREYFASDGTPLGTEGGTL